MFAPSESGVRCVRDSATITDQFGTASYTSKGPVVTRSFGTNLLSAMCYGFGGHLEETREKTAGG